MAPPPTAPTPISPFLSSLLPVEGFLSSLLFLWLLSELLFLLYYRLILLPRANDPLDDCDDDDDNNKDEKDECDDETSSRGSRQRQPARPKRPKSRPVPAPYRDYDQPKDGGRHKLMLRIMERIERTCAATGQDVRAASAEFINGWFRSEVEGVTVEELLSANETENEVEVGDDKEVRTTAEEGSGSGSGSSLATPPPSMAETESSDDDDDDSVAAAEALSNGAKGDAKEVRFDAAASAATRRTTVFPRRDDMDSFLSWAFFASHYPSLSPSQLTELEKIYAILKERHSITFLPGKTDGLVPMRLTLEDVDPVYRPLAVYVFFRAVLYGMGCLALRCAGFRFRTARDGGLTYWYRPGVGGEKKGQKEEELESKKSPPPLPLLFFHGIAPGGLTLYLPLLLGGLLGNGGGRSKEDDDKGSGRGRRAVLLFENRNISFFPALEAVDELDTVRGVREAMNLHLTREEKDGGVTIAGHSFGTFQLTWLLRDREVRKSVRQVLLMDPVSVLLSEPDVITNFVYGRRQSPTEMLRPIVLFPKYYAMSLLGKSSHHSSLSPSLSSSSSPQFLRKLSSLASPPKSIPEGKYNKIWMVQSELFIEHYLRRNFWWYNNELFPEDVPEGCKVVVCLSGKDEILSARKVKREVEIHLLEDEGDEKGEEDDEKKKREKRRKDDWTILHWSEGGHAHCVPRPAMWREIRDAVRRQEEEILLLREDEEAKKEK